jgi:hydrogenase 3 maturation protease
VLGIGNPLGGDDAAGVLLSRLLLEQGPSRETLLVLEGGLAPENKTGAIRAFRPHIVLLVDAALLDQPPGTLDWVDVADIDGLGASSHSLPLSLLVHYLVSDINCEVHIIGIQPAHNDFAAPPSQPVRHAVGCLAGWLAA